MGPRGSVYRTTGVSPRVSICGLGPGDPGHVTEQTKDLVRGSSKVFVRTTRHPTASLASGASSFDDVYDKAEKIVDVYSDIANRLLAEAQESGHVVYAVPGSPLILERSVANVRQRATAAGVKVTLVPAVSFLDEVWARLQIDPVSASVRLIDGLDFARAASGQTGPLLVAHVHSQWVLSDIKLALDANEDQRVTVLQRLGTDDENITEVAWPDLDRLIEADHLTTLYVPELAEPVSYEFVRSVEMMRRLRTDCPWDADQDHGSLRKYLIEEAYEVLDALDQVISSNSSGASLDDSESYPYADLEEELGDLWFQILFHSLLAEEQGQFSLNDVLRSLTDKMVHRHPHVFSAGQSDDLADGTDEVSFDPVANWDERKQEEKHRKSQLDGVPSSLPSLALASKILSRAAKKISDPAVGPLAPSMEPFVASSLSSEAIGDNLLVLAELGRRQGIDLELSLRAAVARASERFRSAERQGALDRNWIVG